MAPRWFTTLCTLVMKRRGRRARVAHYDVDDDSDDEHCPSGIRTPTEKHAHTDWGHRHERPSARTSYIEVPVSPNKRQRQRASSTPPSLPSLAIDDESATYDTPSQPVDLDYLYHQMEQLDTDDAQGPRKRTAGVSSAVVQFASATDNSCSRIVPSSSGSTSPTTTLPSCYVSKGAGTTPPSTAIAARRAPCSAATTVTMCACSASSALSSLTMPILVTVSACVPPEPSYVLLTKHLHLAALGLRSLHPSHAQSPRPCRATWA